MAKYLPLNTKEHRKLRVNTARGAEFGENVHLIPVIADELRNLVLDYPVFIMKDPETDRFGMCALLGFEAHENLYLEGDRWNAIYLPAHIRRQPFILGFRGEERTPENSLVSLDMDHKRVQEEVGELLFDDEGKATPYLENISQLLGGMMAGLESTRLFIELLSEHDLIEPAQINVTFGSGEMKSFEGLYTVNDEKLGELSGEVLQTMHKHGYLQAASLLIASMGQMQRLIDLKNSKQAG
jgi:hypothetical protein